MIEYKCNASRLVLGSKIAVYGEILTANDLKDHSIKSLLSAGWIVPVDDNKIINKPAGPDLDGDGDFDKDDVKIAAKALAKGKKLHKRGR